MLTMLAVLFHFDSLIRIYSVCFCLNGGAIDDAGDAADVRFSSLKFTVE